MKKSRTGSFAGEAVASPPVATVQLPLPLWDAVTTVREGFFALCVATGQQVLAALIEHNRRQLCGPKNVPNPARTAYRAGSVTGEVREDRTHKRGIRPDLVLRASTTPAVAP